MIDASKIIFKATIFAESINKIEGFTRIYITDISNISLKLYFWYIFLFHPVVEIIWRALSLEKYAYSFYFTDTVFIVYIDVVNRLK